MENIENKELQPQPGERILSKIEKIQSDYIASRIKKEESPRSKVEKKHEDADWQEKVEKVGEEAQKLFESFDLSWLSEAQENFILGKLNDNCCEYGEKPIWRDGIEEVIALLVNMKTLNKS